jgi:hypothetical protein
MAWALILAALLAGCAHTPPEFVTARTVPPGLLKNADFEADPDPSRRCPPSWGCLAHSNAASYTFELASDARSHGRYLKVTRVHPEPWAMANQLLPAAQMAGKRLRISVSVLGEALEGGAGPMVILQGPGGRVLGHRQATLTRGPGWRRASVEIDVVPGTERVECGLLVEGSGWAGFDDV